MEFRGLVENRSVMEVREEPEAGHFNDTVHLAHQGSFRADVVERIQARQKTAANASSANGSGGLRVVQRVRYNSATLRAEAARRSKLVRV